MIDSIGDGTSEMRRWRDVGEVPLDIWNSLNSLPRGSLATEEGWYPASATLKNGDHVTHVAFVETSSAEGKDRFYFQTGFLRRKYQFDRGGMIDINSVASVSVSPYATPLEIQEKMLRIRSDAGRGVCRVVLRDGKEYLLAWRTDEFVNVPRGYQAKDIVDIVEASDKERDSFPSSELKIWGETSDSLSLGLMCVFLDYSQQLELIGHNDRAMLCFFKRPRLRRNSGECK